MPRELLAGFDELSQRVGRSRRIGLWVAVVSGAAAIIYLFVTVAERGRSQAEAFFGIGSLLLIAGLAMSHWLLSRKTHRQSLTVSSLGRRNSTRRRGRSLATIGLLACGSFLVVSVGANRRDPLADATDHKSGTGGFALFGQTTIPVIHDLNTAAGRDAYSLDAHELAGVSFVPFRVRQGDDASCLNLNRAQVPRLLGVRSSDLAERGAFTFSATEPDVDPSHSPWDSLNSPADPNNPKDADTVPAIGDEATVVWGLGKKLGDTIRYTDERGKDFNVRIVGLLAGSILQGDLIIAEPRLLERFPSQSGYQVFLIDAPFERVHEVKDYLSRAMEDVGLDLTPAVERLAAFQAVENTYLSIFQVLGGLGLLLGCAGLGMVVLRNVLERRSELALLQAVGFRRGQVVRLLLAEHWSLLLAGLLVGVASGLIAVLPAIRSLGTHVPYLSLSLTLAAVLASGLFWIWLATRWALRGRLLSALVNE